MEQLLFLGLIVIGFLLGGLLYKRFGSYVSFTNRCLLKVLEEISHRGDLWRPQECKKRILAGRKHNAIITLVFFILTFLFFHPAFIISFCVGYLFWWLLWRNKTGLTQSNIQKAIAVFMPYILPDQEDNFAKELASAYTYLLTGIHFRPPVNEVKSSSAAASRFQNEAAVPISKEIWKLILQLAENSSYAQNAFDATVLWSILLYSIKPELDAHNLTNSVQHLYAVTVGPMYNITADSGTISELVALQENIFDALVSTNLDVYHDDDIQEIMSLYKTLSRNPDDHSEVSVSSEDVAMLNQLFYKIDRHVNSVLLNTKIHK